MIFTTVLAIIKSDQIQFLPKLHYFPRSSMIFIVLFSSFGHDVVVHFILPLYTSITYWLNHLFFPLSTHFFIFKSSHYGLEVCLLQNSYLEALIPGVMVVGGGDLGEVIRFRLGHEDRKLIIGLVPFKRRKKEISHSLYSHIWKKGHLSTQWEGGDLQTRRASS